jgi:hypothetical protein
LALSDDGHLVLIDTNAAAYKELARADVLDGKCSSHRQHVPSLRSRHLPDGHRHAGQQHLPGLPIWHVRDPGTSYILHTLSSQQLLLQCGPNFLPIQHGEPAAVH